MHKGFSTILVFYCKSLLIKQLGAADICLNSALFWHYVAMHKISKSLFFEFFKNKNRNPDSSPVWPDKNCQMSMKVVQKWFHSKNE